MRVYKSFEEIDNDLAIRKLERDIAAEKVKLNLSKTKEQLMPTNLLGGFTGIARKFIITYIVRKILK
ncbi:hypothetical protein SAMN05216480_10197 [Pustulibacterium marinum]|uniref:Glutaminyl-tRNA synthetase n=1 Tax=Pustulibacterium marinum TaxID=1224947 RepID=A0A1I7ETG6_9FLAO|nr:DUF6327 family protein [Pustulibacterium marinum]SFU27188.1 hypothetical protein SAMN05216480_10197 [Pustulibacterium marinum]